MVSFSEVQSKRGTTVVSHGVVQPDKQWLVDLAAKEAAAREAAAQDGAMDAPAIDPSEIASHKADVRTHNANHAAATTPMTGTVTPSMFATLMSELARLDREVEALKMNTSTLTNAYALKEKEVATLRNSVAGSALKTQAIPEVAAKTGSTAIIKAMTDAAGLESYRTTGTVLEGRGGPGNRWLPLRRMARERAAAANNGLGRTFDGSEPITTDEQLLAWLNTPNVQIATTPWLFIRSLSDTPSIWIQAYRNLFTASPAAGGKGWTDAQFDPYVVPFGQHPTDPTE